MNERPPAIHAVVMFKVLALAVQNNVAGCRIDYLIRDRLIWLGFLCFV